jgi:phosphatidylinositol 4-kinase
LLDEEGHLIHIDYGFMLWNTPGSINFETAPFKITDEYIELIGGLDSTLFHYFKSLLTRGFLAARKHMDRIVALVEMMMPGTKMPCLTAGQPVIDALKERFVMDLTEAECIQHVEQLLMRSVNNWRTLQYDKYQYLTNGYLY